MSSDNEDFELNYGLDDEYTKSFGKTNELDSENEDECEEQEALGEVYVMPRYETNPKLNSDAQQDELSDKDQIENENQDEETNEEDNGGLEDLLNLIEQEDNLETNEDEAKHEEMSRKKLTLKRSKDDYKSIEASQSGDTLKSANSTEQITAKPSTQSQKEKPNSTSEQILVENNTGIRLVKSKFANEIELNMNLVCNNKFYKLTEISRRMHQIKEQGSSYNWYSVFILGSKTESKCSAKGNNYVIWQLHDLGNLEKQHDISLFLFGNAYKMHWKSSQFEVFALIKPDFLDSNKSNSTSSATNNSTNTYYNGQNTSSKNKSNWNKFASKNLKLNEKLTMSVKSDSQLIPLGFAKDIAFCQSFSKGKPVEGAESTSKRCANLVNVEQAPYCTFHCVQIDKSNKMKQYANVNKGKYSMAKTPDKAFSFPSISSQINSGEFKFVPSHEFVKRQQLNASKANEDKSKLVKNYKTEILMSLNSSITKEAAKSSPILANVVYKTIKKSDQELMASLEGRQLDEEELRKIKLAEQETIRYQSFTKSEDGLVNKAIKTVFNSKSLLPTDTNYNTISGKKLGELKAMAPQALLIKSSVESSSKEKLSKMQSHRDILKEVKKQNANAEKNEAKNEEKIKETPATTTPVELKPSNSGLIASDFLAKRVNEIKRLKANLGSSPNSPKSISSINSTKTTTTTTTDAAKSTDGFDLELYIGDSVTSKKLLDVNNKYVPFSPKTCTSESYKRKLAELSPAALNKPSEIVESADEKKQKKLKLMDEILSIKSNHSKEVFDPDKNPQLRAYYDKLQQQEEAANRLCNMKNREVKVVSCKTCDYTAFSQSDFCKLKKHAIIRHNVMQRFFKCKSCSKRMYTLDQIVPTKPCSCGAEKYEICTMKEEDISLNIQKSSKVDLDSETPFG